MIECFKRVLTTLCRGPGLGVARYVVGLHSAAEVVICIAWGVLQAPLFIRS
ncbi:hypothetical protein ECED1_3518 [Escherichia coli ED1a]|uniref:Uncharacterized protein n=1 Tax=Escherichia coli O81 (strain ED1a) TaxID=585397 RepID=B7N002_ECO81|nr:hypothetical protein ECED1_3518 [Escherichia coli ED1a]